MFRCLFGACPISITNADIMACFPAELWQFKSEKNNFQLIWSKCTNTVNLFISKHEELQKGSILAPMLAAKLAC
jgi:hypothetical protein